MIDHVSIPVTSIEASMAMYDRVLLLLGMSKLVSNEKTAGYGKSYPEFWLNRREKPAGSDGFHICFRARSCEIVDAFHKQAMESGFVCGGAPGLRVQYSPNYYAAFIVDRDGNKVEVVTFLENLAT